MLRLILLATTMASAGPLVAPAELVEKSGIIVEGEVVSTSFRQHWTGCANYAVEHAEVRVSGALKGVLDQDTILVELSVQPLAGDYAHVSDNCAEPGEPPLPCDMVCSGASHPRLEKGETALFVLKQGSLAGEEDPSGRLYSPVHLPLATVMSESGAIAVPDADATEVIFDPATGRMGANACQMPGLSGSPVCESPPEPVDYKAFRAALVLAVAEQNEP